MRIIWTDDAVANVEAIVTYVATFNPPAADRIVQRLIEVADSLAKFPNRGRDAGDGRREMTTVSPYVLRYRVMEDTVFVLRVRHSARHED